MPADAPHDPPPAPARLNAAQWRGVVEQVSLFFEVTSNSMAPAFRAGEHVSIRPLKDGEPRPGQILAYFHGGLITHRYTGGGVCRGDNAPAQDPPVGREDMVGIVTAVKRAGKIIPLADRIPFRTRLHRLRIRGRQIRHLLGNVIRRRP